MSVALDASLRISSSLPAESTPDTESVAAGGEQSLKVGTYNVGAGNDDARADFDDTRRLIAEKVTGDDPLDVLALQEMDVGTGRIGCIYDYNEAILADILRAEAGVGEDAAVNRYSIDAEGRRVAYEPNRHATSVFEVTDQSGRTYTMTVNKESYDENGNPFVGANGERAFDTGGGSPITVYSAEVRSGGETREYNMVYGSSISHDGGTYGNAVLLGPGARLQRDANGEIVAGSLVRHDLGANDPKDGENRTALAVGIESGGERSTVISAHFTSDGGDEGSAARDTQYTTLGRIAEGYGDKTVVLGDFNSSDKKLGELEGANDPGFWSWGSPIDRIYVSDDVEASDRDHVEGGGSDHNMITWDVKL
jgi:endonuclease/exonuclease/phosphatase family metal-dependent hydrolase